MARIPLPRVTMQEPRRSHPFPFQIGYQTLEFLQGTLFHASFADTAAGQQVRRTDGVQHVEKMMKDTGLAPNVIDQGWAILQKYKVVFEGYVYQSALIAMNSHWDWYVRRLTAFIRYARGHAQMPVLAKNREAQLARADFLAISEQLKLIEESTGIDLLLTESDTMHLSEMTLVRNIGLHNRWEVDDRYLSKTNTTGLSVGDLRLIAVEELQAWHSLLMKVINRSSIELAKACRDVPITEI